MLCIKTVILKLSAINPNVFRLIFRKYKYNLQILKRFIKLQDIECQFDIFSVS